MNFGVAQYVSDHGLRARPLPIERLRDPRRRARVIGKWVRLSGINVRTIDDGILESFANGELVLAAERGIRFVFEYDKGKWWHGNISYKLHVLSK
jgi:hypothetical protein